jgi:hypothetical protein
MKRRLCILAGLVLLAAVTSYASGRWAFFPLMLPPVLLDADLPAAVGGTFWGMPGHASCGFNKEGKLDSVNLTWGGALIAHHGLVISEEEIPFRGTGFHFTDERGQDIVNYPERYYPLYPGAYIFIDEN